MSCAADPGDRPARWSYIHAAIIAPSCATSSCHSALAATAGLTLDDPDASYQALLARQYVIPGDMSSTLLSLLAGNERKRMPPDAPLPTGDIALVTEWIDAGAPR
jgi:Planctomycete cytochrome C